jgi:uncharacterized Zn-finger protein
MRWQFFKATEDRRRTSEKISPSSIDSHPAELRCPLCGKTFHAGEAMQCATCGLAKKCGLVMCPYCNYEFTQ